MATARTSAVGRGETPGSPSDRGDVDAAIAAVASGGIVILTERTGAGGGFMVAAGRTVTADAIAAMLRDARGMTWLALPDAQCRALDLDPVPYRHAGNVRDESIARDFMVSIEARRGTTTGISAAERAHTMRVASDPAGGADDVVSPGHITPIRAREPESPARPGIVEAAVELVALAGQPGGAAMCQLLDDDGEIADQAQAAALAAAHRLPLVDELDVLDHLLPRRALVAVRRDDVRLRVGEHELRAVVFRDRFYRTPHVALVCGEPAAGETVDVEVVVQDPLLDVFDAGRNAQLLAAVERLARTPPGVLAYVSNVERLLAADTGAGTGAEAEREALLALRRQPYVVAQMLEQLAVTRR